MTTTTTTATATSVAPVISDEDDYESYDIWDDYFDIPEQKNLTSIQSSDDKKNVPDGLLFLTLSS